MEYMAYYYGAFLFFLILLPAVMAQAAIDITPYEYPMRDKGPNYQIAIFATTDIHGRMLPMVYYNNKLGLEYESGGVEYMGTYISILREEWKERFLWFDAGDQMRGGIEYALSKGEIMNSFYNIKKVSGMTLGNHEFDEGIANLKQHMEKSNFDYIVANLKEISTGKTVFLPKQVESKLYTVEEVKIGVIGVVTNSVKTLSGGDLSDIEFLNHREVIKKEAKKLKADGANAVILLAHMGPLCQGAYDLKEKMKLLIRERDTKQDQCKYDEEFSTLMDSIQNEVDLVLSGHMHDVSHHWIKNIPVVESSGSDYSNIIYLSFNKDNKYEYLRSETVIEGPLPSCGKVFSSTLRCDYLQEKDTVEGTELKSFTFHGKPIIKDKELEEPFKPWVDIVNKKRQNKLATTKSILFVEKYKETTLANLVTDLTRRKTGADFALFNYGGMRATWYPRDITELDIDIMFPFDDNFATFIMYGSDLIRFIQLIHRKQNIVPTSGVTQTCIRKEDGNIQVVDLRFFDGGKVLPIDEFLDYKVGSIKFLLDGGDGLKEKLEWYKYFEYITTGYGTIKQAMMEFLPQIGELDDSMFIDQEIPRLRFMEPLK